MLILLWLYFSIHYTFGWQTTYWQKYSEKDNAEEASKRMLMLMWSYYEDASQRISDLRDMRYMYEESPHYETGYVMHEIIERYKKMVEEVSRMETFKSNGLYDSIGHTEKMQKLYFEIYHLVNMVHEIPHKWKGIPEFKIKKPGEEADEIMNKERMIAHAQQKRREERRRKRLLKKRMDMIKQGLIKATDRPKSKKPINKHWPLDYGWEIDNWW